MHAPRSDAYLQTILETAVDAIVTINSRGIILSFNRAAVRMFGYSSEEAVGHNISLLMPSPFREEHDRYIGRYLQTREPHIIGIGREVMGLRKDGRTFPIELAVSHVVDQGEHFFVGILRDVSEQRYLEKALVDAIENERREIGRDLHDALGQIITGISLMSKSLAKKLTAHEARLAQEAQTIAEMCGEAMAETKRLAYGAYPTELERQGLKTALIQIAETVHKLHHVDAQFQGAEAWTPLDPTTELHLYRIAQESVANAIKHGRPRRLIIALEQGRDMTCLRVTDDGIGLPEQMDPAKISMGLDIMRHRASLIGGDLRIHSPPTGGTEVLCCIRNAFLLSRRA